MRAFKIKWYKIFLWVFLALVVYSFLPMIHFWTMKGASNSDNNQVNVAKLKQNKGAYFSFIVFGDSHVGLIFNDAAAMKEVWHMNIEDRFRKIPIDFVLSVGDVTLDGSRWDYKASKKVQELIKYPVITTIGNHDAREIFSEYYGEKEFSFVNRNSYFIILDNEVGELKDAQFEWLEQELEKGQEYDHIFISMHKPPFDPYQQDWYNMDNQVWAYRFRKLAAKYDVDMVFCGHKHMFKAETFDGVQYICTGGGGMLIEIPEENGGYLHYVTVQVNNDYVTYEVRKISPPLWEYVTYYMWKEVFYWTKSWYGSGYIFWRNTKMLPERVKDLNDREYWSW